MPLGFNSFTHGHLAFGFFNIDTDLLLLDSLFFWATDFCRLIQEISTAPTGQDLNLEFDAWRIDSPTKIGNLHGAIAGVDHTGFIGQVYARFPFPPRPEDFRQTEGAGNRGPVAELLAQWSAPETAALSIPADGRSAALAEYGFTTLAFQELIRYVWMGGMPRWRPQGRPDYVADLAEPVGASGHPLLQGLSLPHDELSR